MCYWEAGQQAVGDCACRIANIACRTVIVRFASTASCICGAGRHSKVSAKAVEQ